MKLAKQLAYAVFIVFLCVIPLFASAQDGEESISRLIDMPNVEGDNAGLALTEAIRTALGDSGHLVFNEEEMRAAAKNAGMEEEYWKTPEKIAALNKSLRHDAVIVSIQDSASKKPGVNVTIYNAFTGEVAGSFEQKLKKKNKLSKDESKALLKSVNEIVKTIDANNYPYEIVITVKTDPEGATITKDGVVIGTTPFEYKITEVPGGKETWVITLGDHTPITQEIALDESKNYNFKFRSGEGGDSTSKSSSASSTDKVENGVGRPIFMVAANASPSIHDFHLSDKTKTQLSHQSSVYPMFSLDLAFFPFPLFLNNEYLQGLGIQVSGAFAQPFLDTKFSFTNSGSLDTKCKFNEKDNTYTCSTMEYRVTADIVYRLLLQKNADGHLNPNGMTVDFFVGFNWFNHIVETNPSFNGNNYGGIRVGAAYSTPIVLDQLRIAVKAAFVYNLLKEDPIRYNKLGEKRDMSLGAQAGLDILYDIYKGLFVHAGYNLLFVHSNYSGYGCSDSSCTRPVDSSVNDFYHEIVLGVGYMLY